METAIQILVFTAFSLVPIGQELQPLLILEIEVRDTS